MLIEVPLVRKKAQPVAPTVPFYFVDVFAEEPLQGNPVGVIPDADHLDDDTMRAIAREFNQSETTFVVAPTVPTATVRLRSFTPNGSEVFGAGHNALGAWLLLVHLGRVRPGGSLFQQIGPDLLPVEVSRDSRSRAVVSMAQSAPTFGRAFTDVGRLSRALGLVPSAIVSGQNAQVVSTGAGHLLVPVTDRTAVDGAIPDPVALTAILEEVGGEGCYLYSRYPRSEDAVAYTRFFNPIMGIAEDPATGTAAGPLIALLVARNQLPDDVTAIVEQGHAAGRPSRIRVSVHGGDVRVSGSGRVVADGNLHL